MATEGPRFYDAHDVMASERTAEPEPVETPPIDPRELEAKYLLGMAFPAGRAAVVESARANGAPERAFELLGRLEDREYADAADLTGALERIASGAEPAAPPAVSPTRTGDTPFATTGETGMRTARAAASRRVPAAALGLVGLLGLVVLRRRRR